VAGGLCSKAQHRNPVYPEEVIARSKRRAFLFSPSGFHSYFHYANLKEL
jgi:hypothetical protein